MTVADIRFDWNPSMDAVPESLRGYPAEMGEREEGEVTRYRPCRAVCARW